MGLIGLALPGALGTGYGWVQAAMGPDLLEMSLWVVVALPFAKILSTSLSIGSGGSGGIFGPGMVIGGFLGAVAWRLLSPFAPQVPLSPSPFVVVGMIACFGGIAHAPLAVMLMVAEMTGTLELLPPAMLAVGVATLVVGDRTIYRSQLGSRHDSPAYRLRFGMSMLSSISMSGAMDPPRVVLPSDTTAPDALERLAAEGLEGAPVADAAGAYVGVVTLGALAERADGATSGRLADAGWPTLPVESSLEDAIESMVSGQVNWVPVLDNDDRVAGVMGAGHLISEYRRAVDTSRRRLARAHRGASLIDENVSEGSPFAGRAVTEAGWPPGTLLIAVQRGDQLIFPRGDTVLRAGDTVTLLAAPDEVERLRAGLAGDVDEDDEGSGGPDLI